MKMEEERLQKAEKEAEAEQDGETAEPPEYLPITEYYPSEDQCYCCLSLRLKCYDLVMWAPFGNTVIAAILLNMLVLAAQYYDMSADYEETLRIINMAFTIFFAVEMVLKLLGLGIEQYLADGWNVLDGIVVIATL